MDPVSIGLGLLGAWSGYSNSKDQQSAMADANAQSQASNAATLAAQQKANEDNLNMQKVLAYFQMLQGNQTDAQQLAGAIGGQQNSLNTFAQLYNQDMTNRLPQQVAGLAGLQAMTPLMQMAGMQGYQMPTSLDTTKLGVPDVLKQFQSLSTLFQNQNNQNTNPQALLSALSDPESFMAGQGGAAGHQAPQTPGVGGQSWAAGQPGAVSQGSYPGQEGQVVFQNGQTYVVGPKNTGTGAQNGLNALTPLGGSVAGNQGQDYAAYLKQYQDYMAAQTAQAQGQQAQTAATNASMSDAFNSASGTPTPSTYNLTPTTTAATPMSLTTTSPGYQWRMSEAQKALDNSLSARGLRVGGAATQAQTDLASKLSGEEFQNQYNRYMDLVKLGMGMDPGANQGQSAANSMAGIFNQGTSNTSTALQNAANNRSSLYSNLGSSFGNYNTSNAGALSGYNNTNTLGNNALANWQSSQSSPWSIGVGSLSDLYKSGAFGSGTSPTSSSWDSAQNSNWSSRY